MDACILRFRSLEILEKHLSYGHHKFEESKPTQLARVTDNWVQRFQEGSVQLQTSQTITPPITTNSTTVCLNKGWAIPERVTRRLTAVQKKFLDKIYDHSEVTGNKASAERAEKDQRSVLKVEEWLLVSTIKSYFSRRTTLKKKGKIKISDGDETTDVNEVTDADEVVDAVGEHDSDIDEEAEEIEAEEINEIWRAKATASIFMAISGLDIQKDKWIAVGYPRGWYPGQFVQFDSEEEEIQVHFLQRSSSNKIGLYGQNCQELVQMCHGYAKVRLL